MDEAIASTKDSLSGTMKCPSMNARLVLALPRIFLKTSDEMARSRCGGRRRRRLSSPPAEVERTADFLRYTADGSYMGMAGEAIKSGDTFPRHPRQQHLIKDQSSQMAPGHSPFGSYPVNPAGV